MINNKCLLSSSSNGKGREVDITSYFDFLKDFAVVFVGVSNNFNLNSIMLISENDLMVVMSNDEDLSDGSNNIGLWHIPSKTFVLDFTYNTNIFTNFPYYFDKNLYFDKNYLSFNGMFDYANSIKTNVQGPKGAFECINLKFNYNYSLRKYLNNKGVKENISYFLNKKNGGVEISCPTNTFSFNELIRYYENNNCSSYNIDCLKNCSKELLNLKKNYFDYDPNAYTYFDNLKNFIVFFKKHFSTYKDLEKLNDINFLKQIQIPFYKIYYTTSSLVFKSAFKGEDITPIYNNACFIFQTNLKKCFRAANYVVGNVNFLIVPLYPFVTSSLFKVKLVYGGGG